MPRPRAATRALFEDTGTRRCGGKFNVFICKRCGVEILENAYRFAVHISVCKKANDDDRALAAQQLNKSKKSNANTPRNSVPGDVDIYSAGVGRPGGLSSEHPGPDSGYGVSHRHSESILTHAARRLRAEGPDDYFGNYGMPSRPSELSGGGGALLGMGSFPYRRSDGYDLYGVEFEGGGPGGQPDMFPGMGRSHDLASGMLPQGPAKVKPEWGNAPGDDQRQGGNYGARYSNWRSYDPQSEAPAGGNHRFGDHLGMPGRGGAEDFADSSSAREYYRGGPPPPYGSQEPGGPYGSGYPGAYHPDMPSGSRLPSGFDAGDGGYGAPPSDYYSGGPPQMGAGFSGAGAPPSSYGYGGGYSGSKAPYGMPDREEGGSNFFGGPDGMGGGAPGWSNSGMPERSSGYGYRPPMDDAPPPNYYQGSS